MSPFISILQPPGTVQKPPQTWRLASTIPHFTPPSLWDAGLGRGAFAGFNLMPLQVIPTCESQLSPGRCTQPVPWTAGFRFQVMLWEQSSPFSEPTPALMNWIALRNRNRNMDFYTEGWEWNKQTQKDARTEWRGNEAARKLPTSQCKNVRVREAEAAFGGDCGVTVKSRSQQLRGSFIDNSAVTPWRLLRSIICIHSVSWALLLQQCKK